MSRIVSWNVNGLYSLTRRLPLHIPIKSQSINVTTTTTNDTEQQPIDSQLIHNDIQQLSAMQKCLMLPCTPTIICHTLSQLFNTLQCDIICIQEHKLVNINLYNIHIVILSRHTIPP